MIKSEIIGIDEVIHDLEGLSKEVQAKAIAEMKASAMRVKSDAQRTLKKNGKYVYGKLHNSGNVRTGDKEAVVEFNSSYAGNVEFGQRIGTVVSYAHLKDWVKKKGLASKKNDIGRIAYFVKKKIKASGVKKSPFLRPAFERERIKFKNNLKNLIK